MKIDVMAAFGLNLVVFGLLYFMFFYLPSNYFQLFLFFVIFIGVICTVIGLFNSINEKKMTL